MKKFLSLAVAIILISTTVPVKATAVEYTFSRILTDETAFYSDSQGKNFKFYLPYSYYVKILSVGTTYTKISYGYENSEYPFLTGYIRTVDLNGVDDNPTSPYAKSVFSTVSDGVLFSDVNLTQPKTAVYSGSNVYYYGKAFSQSGNLIYYVYYDGWFGYMKKDCFSDFELSPHPNPIVKDTFKETDDKETEPVTRGCQTADNLQIIIISAISVIAISLVYLLFKPNDQRTKSENDDELS